CAKVDQGGYYPDSYKDNAFESW
nr:immunoglobulin heavy chain junction region [Macaca mulatta]MOV38198.1 immunoglobulin heavy chain junction region [Macaca mulatta]MOV38807.1 immunoglobulin heavy chain junction region [Macaca mulatta]MOV38971.1 immunoglobulin heavy chain junction region [Macaca mulatta]MOV39408.1 immunoglobulin heavy chain junction region [Macaca mulatta]